MADAVVFAAPGRVEYCPVDVPLAGPGEMALRTVSTLVSPGTELRSLAGRQSGLTEAFPFIPGYCNVGRDDDGRRWFVQGTAHASIARGWGAHVSHTVVRREDAIPLPEEVSDAEGVFAKMWGIAWRGVAVSGAGRGASVAVVGLGLVGQLSARLHQAAGAHVLAIDPDIDRRALCPAASARSIAEARETHPGGFDVVVDASGAEAAMLEAVHLLRDVAWHGPGEGATYVVQGSYASPPVLPYDTLFRKEARLAVPRDSRRPDIERLLGRIASGELAVADLAGAPQPPSEAARVYAELAERGARVTSRFGWHGFSD